MVAIHVRDIQISPEVKAKTPLPMWIPILLVVLLIVVPICVYAAYELYMRRRGTASQPNTPAPASFDVEQRPAEPRPSTSKWTLAVPGWNTKANMARRGSDGGFPPGTRHIAFPDPTHSASTDSLDHKVPASLGPLSSVVSPVTNQYPTPPRAVASRTGERYYAN